jgi:hypothetical protein
MYCLERNVDGFPVSPEDLIVGKKTDAQANLFSNNRDFIDSLDVDDLPAEYLTKDSPGSRLSSRPMSMQSASTSASTPSLASIGSSASSAQLPVSPQSNIGGSFALTPLHCTLFLFDDKLMIVKRQSSTISGRKVTGLDDVPKLVKSGGGVAVMDKNGGRKDKLSYRGVVDVLDIIATDISNGGECWNACRGQADDQISTYSSSNRQRIRATVGLVGSSAHTPRFSLRLVPPSTRSQRGETSCDSCRICGLRKRTLGAKYRRKIRRAELWRGS